MRPQFFGGLDSLSSIGDRGEAAADRVGRRIGSAAERYGPGGVLDAAGAATGAGTGVGDLPVGGSGSLGGMLDVAREAARATVESMAAEAAAAAPASAGPPASPPPTAASGEDGAGAGAPAAASPSGDGVDAEPDQVDDDVSGVTGPSASAAGDPYSQLGELMEALEERLLSEIERRGGRFAGVF